jgi:hypothetical protein
MPVLSHAFAKACSLNLIWWLVFALNLPGVDPLDSTHKNYCPVLENIRIRISSFTFFIAAYSQVCSWAMCFLWRHVLRARVCELISLNSSRYWIPPTVSRNLEKLHNLKVTWDLPACLKLFLQPLTAVRCLCLTIYCEMQLLQSIVKNSLLHLLLHLTLVPEL